MSTLRILCKLSIILLFAAVLSCCAEEKTPAVTANPEVEALTAKPKEAEGRLDKIEKEAEHLRKEVDRLNELTSTLTKALRNLELATQPAATLRPETKLWESVKRGMSADEVRNLLGNPEEIRESRTGDIWVYWGSGRITFDRNGRVSYQETDNRLPLGNKVR